ncbi:MAG: GNAT family N-acetyltransferase [Verrucomicrobiota bacterium]
MKDILIRAAQPLDLDVLVDYNLRIAQETEGRELDAAIVRRGVQRLFDDPQKGVYYVTELDGAVAGQLLITYEWSDWRNGDFWWIQSVYVAERFRQHGVFKALFQHVKALADARPDVCGIRLYMDAHNDRARAAYERLGLKPTNYQVFEIDFVLPH